MIATGYQSYSTLACVEFVVPAAASTRQTARISKLDPEIHLPEIDRETNRLETQRVIRAAA
jgi:hypothetical protein